MVGQKLVSLEKCVKWNVGMLAIDLLKAVYSIPEVAFGSINQNRCFDWSIFRVIRIGSVSCLSNGWSQGAGMALHHFQRDFSNGQGTVKKVWLWLVGAEPEAGMFPIDEPCSGEAFGIGWVINDVHDKGSSSFRSLLGDLVPTVFKVRYDILWNLPTILLRLTDRTGTDFMSIQINSVLFWQKQALDCFPTPCVMPPGDPLYT